MCLLCIVCYASCAVYSVRCHMPCTVCEVLCLFVSVLCCLVALPIILSRSPPPPFSQTVAEPQAQAPVSFLQVRRRAPEDELAKEPDGPFFSHGDVCVCVYIHIYIYIYTYIHAYIHA